ncbi:MAG: hypothetical protein LBI69_03980 [Puniceicoccales bacterium]|jgi:hypothetical protein|nr:hypothetical protein [Puniceicoccales bacterium]
MSLNITSKADSLVPPTFLGHLFTFVGEHAILVSVSSMVVTASVTLLAIFCSPIAAIYTFAGIFVIGTSVFCMIHFNSMPSAQRKIPNDPCTKCLGPSGITAKNVHEDLERISDNVAVDASEKIKKNSVTAAKCQSLQPQKVYLDAMHKRKINTIIQRMHEVADKTSGGQRGTSKVGAQYVILEKAINEIESIATKLVNSSLTNAEWKRIVEVCREAYSITTDYGDHCIDGFTAGVERIHAKFLLFQCATLDSAYAVLKRAYLRGLIGQTLAEYDALCYKEQKKPWDENEAGREQRELAQGQTFVAGKFSYVSEVVELELLICNFMLNMYESVGSMTPFHMAFPCIAIRVCTEKLKRHMQSEGYFVSRCSDIKVNDKEVIKNPSVIDKVIDKLCDRQFDLNQVRLLKEVLFSFINLVVRDEENKGFLTFLVSRGQFFGDILIGESEDSAIPLGLYDAESMAVLRKNIEELRKMAEGHDEIEILKKISDPKVCLEELTRKDLKDLFSALDDIDGATELDFYSELGQCFMEGREHELKMRIYNKKFEEFVKANNKLPDCLHNCPLLTGDGA